MSTKCMKEEKKPMAGVRRELTMKRGVSMTRKNVKDQLALSVDEEDRAMKIARDTLTMTNDKKRTLKKVIIDFEMRSAVEKEKI